MGSETPQGQEEVIEKIDALKFAEVILGTTIYIYPTYTRRSSSPHTIKKSFVRHLMEAMR